MSYLNSNTEILSVNEIDDELDDDLDEDDLDDEDEDEDDLDDEDEEDEGDLEILSRSDKVLKLFEDSPYN